jgi:hypothetical protein
MHADLAEGALADPDFGASWRQLFHRRLAETMLSSVVKTNPERVVEALRASSRPMDDDQLSDRSGVKPRQAVNRICRDLERSVSYVGTRARTKRSLTSSQRSPNLIRPLPRAHRRHSYRPATR